MGDGCATDSAWHVIRAIDGQDPPLVRRRSSLDVDGRRCNHITARRTRRLRSPSERSGTIPNTPRWDRSGAKSLFGRYWFTAYRAVAAETGVELVVYVRADTAGRTVETDGPISHHIHTYFQAVEGLYRAWTFELYVEPISSLRLSGDVLLASVCWIHGANRATPPCSDGR